ncbi:MAG TPA: hypothetical protein VMW23_03175 [Sedimentisphaerales bacterium]|nr:hypothetical protein [Sedimentisphaerales bacterium]
MTFALSDIELWERKADKLEQWAKDKPENWIKANNKRFPFNKNKILGQRFAFHEIDTNTEPLKGLDDILRQIRWGKPSTADVLQKKYDEFFANLRASFPLIQNGDDCFWAVLVLRGDAFDLAKELRNIAQIARNELTPGEPAETGQKNEAINKPNSKPTKIFGDTYNLWGLPINYKNLLHKIKNWPCVARRIKEIRKLFRM